MNSTLQDSFEYRHKKFDQGKRTRSDSSGSSSTDYGSIKLEQEGMPDESPSYQSTFQHASAFTWYPKQSKVKTIPPSPANTSDFATPPQAKRARLNSFQPIIQRHTSTPLSTTAVVVPPTAAILNKISDKTLHSICKYHGNMVRKFPKKERTPKDQERRNKNTVACRMSRRVKKLQHIAIDEQYKEFFQQTFDIIQQSIRATAYLHQLMEMKGQPQEEIEKNGICKMLNDTPPQATPAPPQKKPFTIAFLTGNE